MRLNWLALAHELWNICSEKEKMKKKRKKKKLKSDELGYATSGAAKRMR